MFSQTNRGKIKNAKILLWRWNSANFIMTTAIRPVFITLHLVPYLVRVPLRPACLSANCTNHSATLVMHDFTTLFGNAICLIPARRRKLYVDRAELALKLRFFKSPVQSLIKALRPWDRLSLDFKGPVRGECPYPLVAVDEFSRFPFIFPCKNMKSSTVVACLSSLFAFLVFLAESTAIEAHRLSVKRRGLCFPLEAFLSARPPLTIRLGTACANGSSKPFGEPFSCYCTDVVFLKIDGRMCWPRLFTPSDRSSASQLMKRPTRDCFTSLGDL